MDHIYGIRVYIYKYNEYTDTYDHTEIHRSKDRLLVVFKFIYHVF